MGATRREFLKSGLLVGAEAALAPVARARDLKPASSRDAATTAGEAAAGTFTRGVGVYPGEISQDFRPTLRLDPAAPYRNLALHRPAFASSSYDYNLTAQLVTDGLIDQELPTWIVVVVDGEILPKQEREIVVDHFQSALLELPSSKPTVELHLGGGANLPVVDRMELFVVVPQHVAPGGLTFSISVSEDGHSWREVGRAHGGDPLPPDNYPPDLARGAHLLNTPISFESPVQSRFYRAEFRIAAASANLASATANAGTTEAAMVEEASSIRWRLGQMAFFNGSQRVQIGGPYNFTSAWRSAGLDEEWVAIDLGAPFVFDRVKLHWLARALEGTLQVSDDQLAWRDIQAIPQGVQPSGTDDLTLPAPARGRYVRVLMTRPSSPDGYLLSEVEIFGRGGFIAEAQPLPSPGNEGALNLAGGAWKLQRAGYRGMTGDGAVLSQTDFRDEDWIPATVPGTVLTSYLNIGAIPDPNFGQNQLHVSDSFFYSDFWYRTQFDAPKRPAGGRMLLEFAGVNWKAEVFLNGARVGRVEGAFQRGQFDVTDHLRPGSTNALAILIRKNDTPGSCKQKTLESTGKNGGALGADNPTFHASIGWDWIPTIRGRNTGLWAEVRLVPTGSVTLEDPLVTSVLPLPDTRYADITIACVAVNHSQQPFAGTMRGRLGDVPFEQQVRIPPRGRQPIALSPETHPKLRLEHPLLWWPVGYGDPHLYEVELELVGHGGSVDRISFQTGIRQVTVEEKEGALRLFINGRRLIAKGGSWGFGESMLRYRAREFDAAVRYHREMNFNMIRNWVGQVGDDAFFEACDRHGVMVWQDFWLANPWDGPVPEDNALFLANARDFVSRIRRHPSVALYCGRNEWFPPKALDAGFRTLLAELHPGMSYVGSSADGPVSGHGPYRALTAPEYFQRADPKLHSEIGAPAIPPIESVRAMMPTQALWPLSLEYGLHDFTLQGAQGGEAFLTLLREGYGAASNVEDWVALGEIVSYEAYRAIFEAQSVHRMGTLLWMSHPCWPSFVWQTYDFYLQPTAAYFGSKLGAEPLHIQWNPLQDTIEVVNYSAGSIHDLTATLEILHLDGSTALKKAVHVDSEEDTTATILHLEYPTDLSAVHFLRLTLATQDGLVRSSNFYLRGREQGNLRAIRTLSKASVTATTSTERHDERWILTTHLQNTSDAPALYVRVQVQRSVSGDRITPALYDSNYFALMPKESRTIRTECWHKDTRGEQPAIVVKGFNVA